MVMPALWMIVTEAIYDVRESDIFPRTFETHLTIDLNVTYVLYFAWQ